MIDPTSGQIQFPSDGIRIDPSLSREHFLASPFAAQCRELIGNEPYCSFALPTTQFDGRSFVWSLWFRGSVLQKVSIACSAPEFGSSSWSDWTEDREIARKQLHDSLLASSLGADWSRQRFTWGSVYSVFDPKSGGSSIGVTYGNGA